MTTKHGPLWGLPEVDKSPFSQQNHVAPTLQQVPIHLGFDLFFADTIRIQVGNIDFAVEMANLNNDMNRGKTTRAERKKREKRGKSREGRKGENRKFRKKTGNRSGPAPGFSDGWG